jgi:hypothetical protein
LLSTNAILAFHVQAVSHMSDTPRRDDDPEGRYANYFQIGFNTQEFVIDFGQQYLPDAERIHTRIVTSPSSAQTLVELLAQTLQRYGELYKTRESHDA